VNIKPITRSLITARHYCCCCYIQRRKSECCQRQSD